MNKNGFSIRKKKKSWAFARTEIILARGCLLVTQEQTQPNYVVVACAFKSQRMQRGKRE